MTRLPQLLQRNMTEIFNQRNGAKRKAALQKLWAINGVLWTAEGTYVGRREIERAAVDLLRRYPEYAFKQEGTIDEIPQAARMHWSFGAIGSSPAITGLDVATEINGKITQLYRFLNGAGL